MEPPTKSSAISIIGELIFLPYWLFLTVFLYIGEYLLDGRPWWWTWLIPLLWLWAASRLIFMKGDSDEYRQEMGRVAGRSSTGEGQ